MSAVGEGTWRVPGARVGIVLGAEGMTVRFLGFGTYEGDHEPPGDPLGAVAAWAQWGREARAAGDVATADFFENARWTNPRLRTDDGRVYWGYQVWWGPEAAVRKRLDAWRAEGYEIVETKELLP